MSDERTERGRDRELCEAARGTHTEHELATALEPLGCTVRQFYLRAHRKWPAALAEIESADDLLVQRGLTEGAVARRIVKLADELSAATARATTFQGALMSIEARCMAEKHRMEALNGLPGDGQERGALVSADEILKLIGGRT